MDSLLSAHLCVYVLMVSLCVSESVCLSACPAQLHFVRAVSLPLIICLPTNVCCSYWLPVHTCLKVCSVYLPVWLPASVPLLLSINHI